MHRNERRRKQRGGSPNQKKAEINKKPTRRLSVTAIAAKIAPTTSTTPTGPPKTLIPHAPTHSPLTTLTRPFSSRRDNHNKTPNKHTKPKQYDESLRNPNNRPNSTQPEFSPQPDEYSQDYSDGSDEPTDGGNSMFFDRKGNDNEARKAHNKAQQKVTRLETLKGFLAADPTQYGLDKKGQEQIASQMLEQIEEDQKLEDMTDEQFARYHQQKTPMQQLRDFESVPLNEYLKITSGVNDANYLFNTLKQQDKAKKRFQTKMEGLTSAYEQRGRTTVPVASQGDDDADYDDQGSYEEEDVEVSGEQLQALLAKFKPTVGPNGELIFDEDAFMESGEVSVSSSGDQDETTALATSTTGKKQKKAIQPGQADGGELVGSFDQYHQSLGDDPTIFKYIDDDYEYFIPPGMSLHKLVKMDLPTVTILNYIRKQIAQGQVQTNYMGVSIQQLMKRLQLENLKRVKKGLKPFELENYKATSFKDVDTTGLPEQDIQDLEEYYHHFETFRKLKTFEKMKDNPAFDPNDPDWQDDSDSDTPQISKRQLKQLRKVQPALAKLLTKSDGSVMNLHDVEANQGGRFTEEQRRRILKKYGHQDPDKPFAFGNDDGSDDYLFSEDDVGVGRQLRQQDAIDSGNAFERQLQYPDHKPTIKALQNFVRTVPMDEPLPRELQRRVNMLLDDADYRKLKDFHYMMNDVEIWYLANRLPVVYSIMRRILIEIRQRIPTWKPESVLEFAAGASPALWAVRDIFYQDIGEYTAVERDGRLALLGQQLTADLGIHIYYRSRLLVNDDGQMEVSKEDELKKAKKRAKLSHKQRKMMDKEDKLRKEQQLAQLGKKHTLVFSPYALSKQPNKEYRRLLLEALWDQVDPNGGLLVLIESTEADSSGFNVVRECRDYLLKKYPKTKVQDEHITGGKDTNSEPVITPIVNVEENLESKEGDAAKENSSVPSWAQGATKKLTTEEESQRLAANKPVDPSASSILPCSHDRPCPMGAMLKLNEEVQKLKALAKEEQLAVNLPQIPIKSCMFGQRMLRAPMPNQSPLQDLEIPQFLGDAIIENFSYIVLRRGETPTVKEGDLEVVPYESTILPKGKLNLPGGMTREEYLELKKWEKDQIATGGGESKFDINGNPLSDDDDNDGDEMDGELHTKPKKNKYMSQEATAIAAERAKIKAEQAELGDFIEDDDDGNLEFDLLVQQNDNNGVQTINNLQDIEARRLALDIFGAKSIDNEESMERHTEALISKLPTAMKPGAKPKVVVPESKYDKMNAAMQSGTAEIPLDEENSAEPERDILEDYDLDIIQKELGYELDEESLETLRQVILESERDRPLMNPKREFNVNRWSRVLSPPLKRGGHVVMDLCTPDGNFERRVVGREGVGALGFKQARLMNWGDIWPYKRPMTLRELKEEREAERKVENSQFVNVTSSQEAKDTLKELRDLFGTHYTADQINAVDRYKTQLEEGQDGDNVEVAREDLNFENMDPEFNQQIKERLIGVTKARQQTETRYKLAQQERRRDNTPNVVVESNIFNDPSFYDADIVDDQNADQKFQDELRAHKLLEDLKSLPEDQQALLGDDVASALRSLGSKSSAKSSKAEKYLQSLDTASLFEESTPAARNAKGRAIQDDQKLKKASLLDQLREHADQDREHGRRIARKEFIDDMTEYSEETGLPPGFEDENQSPKITSIPTKISSGVKVDDIIGSVERRIEAIKEDKKERQKLNKKQQKIADKQRQKELAALQKGEPEADRTTGDIQQDFLKLIASNVEFDPSLEAYQQTRQQQDAQLKKLRMERILGQDNSDSEAQSGTDSYDEQNDGPSDYSDGEILHVPSKLDEKDGSDAEQGSQSSAPKPKPIDYKLAQSLNFSDSKPNEWVSGPNMDRREALRAKLFDVMAQSQTDELQAFLDDPKLGKSSTKKERELRKAAKKSQDPANPDGLTRAQRLKKEQMKKEFLFSDDDEWDLNEMDNIENASMGKSQSKKSLEGETPPPKEKEIHTIQGAALDIVDHSYRVLTPNAKAKLGVPLTGKRSFVENMEFLEKNKQTLDGSNDSAIQYVELSQNKNKSNNPGDIFGYRKRNQQQRVLPPRQYDNNNNNNNSKQNKRRFSSTAFRQTTPSQSHTQQQQQQYQPQKSAVLLTMQGQQAPKKSTSTKVIQIGTSLNHAKLYPHRQVAMDALGVNKRGPAIHATSMYNTVLTDNPTIDLSASERTTPLYLSSAGALSKHNKDQIHNVAVNGYFKYDGGLPLGAYSMAKSRDMARKLQGLAGIDSQNGLDAPPIIATPGVASPFVDNSAPPQDLGHDAEAISAQATRALFGHDIYIYEEDPIEKRYYKSPQHDEVGGLLRREHAPKAVDLMQEELDKDPEGDMLETFGRDIYINAMDRSQTRRDEFGNEYAGKMGGDSPDTDTMRHFRQDAEVKRKLESRKKRAEFGMRIDAARETAAKINGGVYTPNTPGGFMGGGDSGPNNMNIRAGNGTNAGGNGGRNRNIDLSTANLGKAPSSGQPFYRERISQLQDEIDEVKKLRRERQRKMLTPLALSDEIARDPEGKPLESIKAQASPFAKTMTEKRASLAVIEQPDEHELRKLRESHGLDYSYTALLTNIDGFGPKMDASGKMREKKLLTPFDQDTITLGELENLAKHASDELRPQLADAVNKAHQALLYDKNVQNNFKEAILAGDIRQVPFKLKLNKISPDQQRLQIGDSRSSKPIKETFDYEIRPLSQQELALIHSEQQRIIQHPDLTRDVENLIIKHQGGLTFKQKQNILAQEHDNQVKLSLQTEQLGSLARRFTQMAQRQEDRDLLRGDSEEEYAFQPPTIPDMQTSWGVKTRTPERHKTATIAADQFVKQQRKFDKLVAEVQEVDLLDKLINKSIKVPESVRNKSKTPYNELEDQRAKELLIKQGIKTRQQIEFEELQEALAFERGMQQAVDETYGAAKQQLKLKLQRLAREGDITPQQFNMDIDRGLLEAPDLKQRLLNTKEQGELQLLMDPNTFVRGKNKKLAQMQQKLLQGQQQLFESNVNASHDDMLLQDAEIIPTTPNGGRHGKNKDNHQSRNTKKSPRM